MGYLYDKYRVLRVETTINDPHEFKIYKDTGKEENVKSGYPWERQLQIFIAMRR